jgi:hypothetical protein
MTYSPGWLFAPVPFKYGPGHPSMKLLRYADGSRSKNSAEAGLEAASRPETTSAKIFIADSRRSAVSESEQLAAGLAAGGTFSTDPHSNYWPYEYSILYE